MNLNKEICRLVSYGLQKELLKEADVIYTVNQLLALFAEDSFEELPEGFWRNSNLLFQQLY